MVVAAVDQAPPQTQVVAVEDFHLGRLCRRRVEDRALHLRLAVAAVAVLAHREARPRPAATAAMAAGGALAEAQAQPQAVARL